MEPSQNTSKAVSDDMDKAGSLEMFDIDQNSRLLEEPKMMEVKFGS